VATNQLRVTLQSLNLRHPDQDLEAALKSGDHRFVCVYGITEKAPGVEELDNAALQRQGMRCLEGTSDAVESPAHDELIRQAISYARDYNVELLRRIGEVPVSPNTSLERTRAE
jgi:hypothetical protein